MSFQIAVQMYTLRDFCQTGDDLTNSLKKVADIGYKAVEHTPFGPLEPEAMKSVLDSAGLTMPSVHLDLDRILNDTATVVDALKLFGCRHAALSAGPKSSAADWVEFAQRLNDGAEALAPAGITLSYHNHHWELERYDGVTALEILMRETDERVGFQIDTYWIQAGGANPVDYINKATGRLPFLHAKDMTMVGRDQHMAEVGEGNLNWPAILAAAKDAGTECVVVEQDHTQRDPFESIAMSLTNLNKLIS